MDTFNIFEKRELRLVYEAEDDGRNAYASPETPTDTEEVANALKNPSTTGVTIPASDLDPSVPDKTEIKVTSKNNTPSDVMNTAKEVTNGLSPQDKRDTSVIVQKAYSRYISEMRNNSIKFTKKELRRFLRSI